MIIYKVINTVNNKVYIGQTRQSLKKRWREHCKKKKTSYLYSAIQKHGADKFIIEVIDTAETEKELNDKEVYWIEFYNSTNREIGYNLKEGGNQAPCHEETKLKIGLANSNKTASPETRANQSAARKGKPLSEETKKRMSESRKGSKMSEYTKHRLMEGKKATPVSEETRRKQSEARKGKTFMSPEKYKELGQKRKGIKRPEISEKLKGFKHNPESIAKRVAKTTGRKNSEEVKQRMRDNFNGGRTGQKNKPESLQKMVEMKAFRKFLKWKEGETISEYKNRTGFDVPIKFNPLRKEFEANEYTLKEAKELMKLKNATKEESSGWE